MDSRSNVLVVGAGPVGLLSALLLKRRGIEVSVVDQAEPSEARSFAVVLHPRTVEMLASFGVVNPLLWQGHSFNRIAVFADGERRALLDVPVDGEFANGGLTLPQNVLRTALEKALHSAGVKVKYGQRLLSLEQDERQVRSRMVRQKTGARAGHLGHVEDGEDLTVVSDFVIGADGYQSAIRDSLGIAMLEVSGPQTFAFFDVPHPPPMGATVELALAEHCSGIYPLHGGMTRYSFELATAPQNPLGASELGDLRRSRIPWHVSAVETVEWSGVRTFRRALAERFGHGRVWLAGDACHAANPLGAQSLNVGLREARELATAIEECLEGRHLERLTIGYAEQRHLEWRRLLAIGGPPTLGTRAPTWAAKYLKQLLGCLPATGDDLDELLAQLSVTLL
jgi:2-polyprenyl-6-methoxyphenol hydroxylase-like FAD-dependent oxidoreductase